MKKVYTKPEIMFESFTLSNNIASDCKYEPDDEALYIPGLGQGFADGNCEHDVAAPDDYNGICYHNPENNNVFSS